MGVIEEFLERYARELDFYEQAARLVAQSIETALQSAGIRSIVSYRAKSPSRLEAKVRQRNEEKRYGSVADIYGDIVDLAGVRVALYFPGQREQVGKVINERFEFLSPPKEFTGRRDAPYPKRFSGYWATHYRLRLRASNLTEAQRRYCEATIEVQVASVFMHAWAEVEHDLVYKPLQGRLSQDEYAILDELNGLAMAGEIALERLQRAGEARVAVTGQKFANHYELAAYLFDKAGEALTGPSPEAALGQVDVLLDFLLRIEKAAPESLDPYLDAVTSDTERRPLAQQIVDQLLAEDEARYPIYDEIRLRRASAGAMAQANVATSRHTSIGRFLVSWAELERLFRDAVASRQGRRVNFMPSAKLIDELGIRDEEIRSNLERIRRLRNNLVHGIEVPDPADLDQATAWIASTLPRLRELLERSRLTAIGF